MRRFEIVLSALWREEVGWSTRRSSRLALVCSRPVIAGLHWTAWLLILVALGMPLALALASFLRFRRRHRRRGGVS